MTRTPKKYPIELALEKLINEVRIGIKKMFHFFFVIPKRKDDKMIYVIETTAWILLGLALIMRLRG